MQGKLNVYKLVIFFEQSSGAINRIIGERDLRQRCCCKCYFKTNSFSCNGILLLEKRLALHVSRWPSWCFAANRGSWIKKRVVFAARGRFVGALVSGSALSENLFINFDTKLIDWCPGGGPRHRESYVQDQMSERDVESSLLVSDMISSRKLSERIAARSWPHNLRLPKVNSPGRCSISRVWQRRVRRKWRGHYWGYF